jgi:hypothetical protein
MVDKKAVDPTTAQPLPFIRENAYVKRRIESWSTKKLDPTTAQPLPFTHTQHYTKPSSLLYSHVVVVVLGSYYKSYIVYSIFCLEEENHMNIYIYAVAYLKKRSTRHTRYIIVMLPL